MKLSKNLDHKGFTLIELMVVIAIIGTLAAITIPNFTSYRERVMIKRAIVEIKGIANAAVAFMLAHNRYPNTLTEAGLGNPVDPWGNLYVYYPMANVPKGVKVRKDKSEHPVSTDFDLYSLGADGKSVAPFTAKASQDDIVRAGDGAFIGLVKNF